MFLKLRSFAPRTADGGSPHIVDLDETRPEV